MAQTWTGPSCYMQLNELFMLLYSEKVERGLPVFPEESRLPEQPGMGKQTNLPSADVPMESVTVSTC